MSLLNTGETEEYELSRPTLVGQSSMIYENISIYYSEVLRMAKKNSVKGSSIYDIRKKNWVFDPSVHMRLSPSLL